MAPYPEAYKGAATDKMAVQYAVIEVLKQVGMEYNWDESYKNTDPVCRQWVKPNIRGVECSKALDIILKPVGLTYSIVDSRVVLQKGIDGPKGMR